MGHVDDTFYEAVLEGIHAPVTAENMKACHAWQLAEGGTADHNPWNTTYHMPDATAYNTFGNSEHVWNYKDAADGIHATIATLEDGFYPRILAAFEAGDQGLEVCQSVDASPWGTRGAAHVYATMQPPGPSVPPLRVLHLATPLLHGPDVTHVQLRLNHYGVHVKVDGWYGPNTVNAVRVFQAGRHLHVDGIVGPDTYRALGITS